MIARALAAIALLALTATVPVWAQNFSPPPRPTNYVTDNASALSSTAKTTLQEQLQEYESKTGHRFLVWIGKSTGSVPLETWTTQTADTWKVGRKGHDDGAVLFVFMDDHKVRIEVGYGLESKLPDATAYRIIQDDIVPRMRASDVDGAIEAGVNAMMLAVTPDYAVAAPPSPAPEEENSTATNIGIVIAILIFCFVLILGIIRIVQQIRYGYLVLKEGPVAARRDMGGWWGFMAGSYAGSSGGSWSGGSSGGGGFSSGGFGGSFGGGGASGSW
ncbi:MAG: TPM domain-containing protein [Candidatus Eremiobacteraeota bacterium]|nr:TPM domain-containing protein [Candidatus Eremiobacteraeota bacterium]